MMYIADLHIHSRYSRATSRDCTPEYLDLWARRKGISIVGTGDFTHPAWRKELEEKLEQLHPSVFFSHELCARYFTYMSRETGAHFILFDDGESLEKKRTLAQELGISRFFLLYPEIADFLPRLVRQEA